MTLPPLTGPGKTVPYTGPNGNGTPKTFPGQKGAGLLVPPQPEDTAKGIPGIGAPSWEKFQEWVQNTLSVQFKGFGWNVLIVLLLAIAFFVMLTGETNPVNAYERVKSL